MKPMTRDAALEISTWSYDEPFNFYDMDGGEEDLKELLNGSYFQMTDAQQHLAGFCCYGHSAQVPVGAQFGAYPEHDCIDFGLGMRPDLTGHGQGAAFLDSILQFLQSECGGESFRLTVATFNTRAIRLYEKLGFTPIKVFPANHVEFVTMERGGE